MIDALRSSCTSGEVSQTSRLTFAFAMMILASTYKMFEGLLPAIAGAFR